MRKSGGIGLQSSVFSAGLLLSHGLFAASIAFLISLFPSSSALAAPLKPRFDDSYRADRLLIPVQGRNVGNRPVTPINGSGAGGNSGNASGQGNANGQGSGNGSAPSGNSGNAPGQGNANGQGSGNGNTPSENSESDQESGETAGGGNEGGDEGTSPGTVTVSVRAADVRRAQAQAITRDMVSTAAVQSTAVTATEAVTTQVQQVVEDGAELKSGESMNGALSAVQHYGLRNGLSVFTVSGISRMRHDGFTISTPDKSFKSSAFESIAYGLTVGTRWDASKQFDLTANKLIFGAFGNGSLTDLSVGGDDDLLVGNGQVTSFTAGGYSLYNAQPFYLLGIASYSWAWSDMDGNGDYGDMSVQSDGYLLSGNIGALLPMGQASLDLRVGTTFSEGFVANYTDGNGAFYSDAELREVNGSASAKLVFTEKFEQMTLRPFVQAGVNQRLDQTNEVVIDGIAHNFDDADFSVFGRVGIDINHTDQIQSYFAMRGEKSEDREEIAGQLGLTFKLD